MTITGICGDVDIQRLVFVIYDGETIGAENQLLDVFKGVLVFCSPGGEDSVTFLHCERGQHTHILG